MMNIVNASMGYSGFQLKMEHSLQLLPPLVADSPTKTWTKHAILALKELELDLLKLTTTYNQPKLHRLFTPTLSIHDSLPF